MEIVNIYIKRLNIKQSLSGKNSAFSKKVLLFLEKKTPKLVEYNFIKLMVGFRFLWYWIKLCTYIQSYNKAIVMLRNSYLDLSRTIFTGNSDWKTKTKIFFSCKLSNSTFPVKHFLVLQHLLQFKFGMLWVMVLYCIIWGKWPRILWRLDISPSSIRWQGYKHGLNTRLHEFLFLIYHWSFFVIWIAMNHFTLASMTLHTNASNL